MKGKIIRVQTTDNVELQGIAYLPDDRPTMGILHFHGSHGNFYENRFLDAFAEYYPQRGFAFVSGNNRGHDGMTVYERFEKCTLDVEAWAAWFNSQGIEEYILQGHSLGAHKVVYYLSNCRDPKVKGAILLSPFDLLAFYKAGTEAARRQNVEATKALGTQDPDALVPKRIFDIWPISVGTYLDLVGYETEADIFPFRTGGLTESTVAKLAIPIFAAIGGDDFAQFPSPSDCVKQLKCLASLRRNVEVNQIQNAPHNFNGHIDELIEKLESWLDRAIVPTKKTSRK